MNKKTFIAYVDWYDYCDGMTDKQKANLFDCIRSYASGNEIIQPLNELQFVWQKIKKQLDKNNDDYKKICEKNSENAKKRRENKQSKKKDATACDRMPNMLDNDNDNDTDNDNVKEEVNKDKNKVNKVNKDNNIIPKNNKHSFSKEKKTRNNDVDLLIDGIKELLLNKGYIYKNDANDRRRAQNILTAKQFGNYAELLGQTRIEFALNVVKASLMLDWWKGKINNCVTLYKNYASIYNEVKSKRDRDKDKELKSF